MSLKMTKFKINGIVCEGTRVSAQLDEIVEEIFKMDDLDAVKAKVIAFNSLLSTAVIQEGMTKESARRKLECMKKDGQDMLKLIDEQIAIKVEADLKAERYLNDIEFYLKVGKKSVAASMLRSYARLVQDFKLKSNMARFEKLSKDVV